MTARPYHEISCNHGWPDRALIAKDDVLAEACYKAYNDQGTATQVRRRARQAGWSVNRPGGKDYCPDHVGKPGTNRKETTR